MLWERLGEGSCHLHDTVWCFKEVQLLLAAGSREARQRLGGGDSNTLTPSACWAGEELGLRMCAGTGIPLPPGCSAAPKQPQPSAKNLLLSPG